MRTIVPWIIIACIAAGLGGLFFWAGQSGVGNLVRTYLLIRANALVQVPTSTLVEGAMKGMVDALGDPYSVYLDKDNYRELSVQIEGSFGGIGVEFDMDKDRHLVIVSVLPGTPAARAGLKSADVMVQIDDKDATQMSLEDAAKLLRGNIGTAVAIKVWRQQENRYLSVNLKREQISLPSAMGRVLPDHPQIAYVQVLRFNQDSTLAQLKQAFAEIDKKGYQALILDLRDNPGGDLQTAVELAGYFVPPGPVVRIVHRGGAEEIWRSSQKTQYLKVPLAVLVNGGSASASEIVAGAIKDTGSGALIGERTFGKGVVQTVFPLSGQVGVKLTTDKYLTPKGIDINKKGIDPDITVKQSSDGEQDLQLQKAVQLLLEKLGKVPKQAA
ncbi:MAG: S41 family peptidase [Thermacetogeniaceae bacterium]